MTTLTPGGQRLADDEAAAIAGPLFVHDFSDPAVSSTPSPGDVTLSCDHPATLTVAFMGNGMSGTLEEARANAAKLARLWNADLDAPPAGGDGGLREALKLEIGKSLDETWDALGELWNSHCKDDTAYGLVTDACSGVEAIRAALARPDPREQAAAGVGGLRRKLVAFNVRNEVDQYEFCGDEGDYTPTERERVLLEDFGNGLASAISDALFPATQPNQTPEAAAPSGSVGEDDRPLILEACEPLPSVPTDYVLTCRWPDGSETVECVSEQAAALLGYRGQWIDGTLAAQQPAPQAPVADAAGVAGLREALQFYADAWEYDSDAQLIGPGVWDGGISCDPSEALRADKGKRARLALAALTSQPNQAPEAAAPSGSVGDALKAAFIEGLHAGWDDNDNSMRPIVGGYGAQGPSSEDTLWSYSAARRAAIAQQPAPQAPVADAAGVDWEREAARLRAELTRIHDFSASSMLIRNDALDMIRSVARQALKSAAITPPQAALPGDGEGLTLRALHTANIARQTEWCPDQVPDLSFRGNELAGETGEACNVIKKLERERQGWRGSRATLNDLAEELADVVICADLCAVTAGIDLDAAVVAKFNATSDKVGISVRLSAPVQADAAEGRS